MAEHLTAPEGCELDPGAWNTLLSEQASTLREQIMQDYAKERPYMNTIQGETHDGANQGEDIRTLVNNRLSPSWSRVAPAFQRSTTGCNVSPERDNIGQTEYTTRMEFMAGRSPDVCVKQAIHGVKNSLNAAYDGMRTGIGELIDNDIRNQYLIRSGVKYNANSTLTRNQRITGGRKQVGTEFNTSVLPDSPMTYTGLINLIQYAQNVLGVEMFGSGVDRHALVIAGFEQVEKFRNEALVNNAILAQTQGGYSDGNDAIKKLEWTSIQHRGIRLNVDMEPLRFNDWGQDGLPDLVEPAVEVSSDHGVDHAVNDAWLGAKKEVGFVIFRNAFKRLVPRSYTGEGQWKFNPQFVMGELRWHNVVDNTCNLWGHTGSFLYWVERAIQAHNPHAVIPFVYQRCALDDGLEPCDGPAIS